MDPSLALDAVRGAFRQLTSPHPRRSESIDSYPLNSRRATPRLAYNLFVQAFHLEYLRSGEPGKQGVTGSNKLRGTMDRLLRLAKDDTLREELTGFALAADSDDAIPAAHRPGAETGQASVWTSWRAHPCSPCHQVSKKHSRKRYTI